MKKIHVIIITFLYCLVWKTMGAQSTHEAMAVNHQELKTAEGTWRYTVNYTGEHAILYLHGASSSKRIWKNQYALQVLGYKNIFVDLLGYGESDQPDVGYSLTTWIDGVRLILEQEGIQKVNIVAHSNGVIIAKEFYRSYPDLVSEMILLDGMLKSMIPPGMLDWMRSTLERSDYQEYMAQNVKRMPVQGLSAADVELLEQDALRMTKAVTTAEFVMVSDSMTWRELQIHCPVTIVHANNPFWNEDYLACLPTIAPGHRLLHWKDAGHFIPLQFPDRLNALIATRFGPRKP